MNEIDILHVASFSGNIGDNANHSGFRSRFESHLEGFRLNYVEYEIRETYWGNRKFDGQFVELANNFDLVIIGGGNYFELWVDHSKTGCSIDIGLSELSRISTPIIFNALGVDPAQGANESALVRFRQFLDLVIESPNMRLSCRNDGSMEALKNVVGGSYFESFYHVPDAGMYTKVGDFDFPELKPDKKNILIQVAGDMLDVRFPGDTEKKITYGQFLRNLVETIEVLVAENEANIILCPHIFSDQKVIFNILSELDDKVRRTSVVVAPYLIGEKGQRYIFGLYAKCNLVLAMRFHANLCAMGLKVPTIGLVNYRQIEKLYEEMDIVENTILCNEEGFGARLRQLAGSYLSGKSNLKKLSLEPWSKKLDQFHVEMGMWLRSYF